MKEIKLSNGMVTKVSDEDHDWISKEHWMFDRYAYRQTCVKGKRRSHRMHRDIALMMFGEIPDGTAIDHINRDKLDNRRENLRLATQSQNNANLSTRKGRSYKGLSLDSKDGKWNSFIGYNYTTYNLGRYKTEDEAAQAYNIAAKYLWGEFANLNDTKGVVLGEDVERRIIEKVSAPPLTSIGPKSSMGVKTALS